MLKNTETEASANTFPYSADFVRNRERGVAREYSSAAKAVDETKDRQVMLVT
jgi:hypothetical protein